MTASEFAAWVLANLETDIWLTEATLARRLAGLHAPGLTAPGLLAALRRAGWLTAHPCYPQEYCLASVCWLSEKPTSNKEAATAGTRDGLTQKAL